MADFSDAIQSLANINPLKLAKDTSDIATGKLTV